MKLLYGWFVICATAYIVACNHLGVPAVTVGLVIGLASTRITAKLEGRDDRTRR